MGDIQRGKLLYVVKPNFPSFYKLIIIITVVILTMGGTFGTLMVQSGSNLYEILRLFLISYIIAIIISYTAYYFSLKVKKDLIQIYERGISISYRSEGKAIRPPKSSINLISFSPVWQLRFKYSFILFKNIKTFYTISSPNNKKIWLVFIETNGKWYTLPTGGFENKGDFNINEIINQLKEAFGDRWEKVYTTKY